MNKFLNFDKPRTITQWMVFLAAIGITLTSPIGTRAFINELVKLILKQNKKSEITIKPGQISRALYYLKKRKIIKLQELGDKTTIILSEKGKKRKLQYDLENIKIPKQKIWDKKWWLLMFDIPESEKSSREALREKLKCLNFFQFQKSVWIYPYPCESEIDFIAEIFLIAPYITLLTVQIDNDKPLREFFKL